MTTVFTIEFWDGYLQQWGLLGLAVNLDVAYAVCRRHALADKCPEPIFDSPFLSTRTMRGSYSIYPTTVHTA